MGYLIHAVYFVLTRIPGLAARTHRPCGRMRVQLQAFLGLIGIIAAVAAVLLGRFAWRGFGDGSFGYFPTIAMALVAGFLLLSGGRTLWRALRNPPPPALPDNVIAFRRPVARPEFRMLRKSVD